MSASSSSQSKHSLVYVNDVLSSASDAGDDVKTPVPPLDAPRKHRCQLFDVSSLLFENKWLGADAVTVQLTAKGEPLTEASRAAFVAAFAQVGLQGNVSIVNAFQGTLTLDKIRFSGPVEAAPILELAPFCLWVEPNKVERILEAEAGKVSSPSLPAPLIYSPTRTYIVDPLVMEAKLTEELAQLSADQKSILKTLQTFKTQLGLSSFANGDQQQIYQSKGTDAFQRMEKAKRVLADCRSRVGQISFVECCSACDRVVAIATGPRLPPLSPESSASASSANGAPVSHSTSTTTSGSSFASSSSSSSSTSASAQPPSAAAVAPSPAEILRLSARMEELGQKLKTASGPSARQRKKKLQRKIKDIKAQLSVNSNGGPASS